MYLSQVRKSIAPRAFRSTLPGFFQGYEQHDSSEFARLLLDKLESELRTSQQEDYIQKHIEGMKVNKIKCLTCSTESISNEKFLDLPVNLQNSVFSSSPKKKIDEQNIEPSQHSHQRNSVQEMLIQSFEAEYLEGDNKYHCSKCEQQVERAVKTQHCKFTPIIINISISIALVFDSDYQQILL